MEDGQDLLQRHWRMLVAGGTLGYALAYWQGGAWHLLPGWRVGLLVASFTGGVIGQWAYDRRRETALSRHKRIWADYAAKVREIEQNGFRRQLAIAREMEQRARKAERENELLRVQLTTLKSFVPRTMWQADGEVPT